MRRPRIRHLLLTLGACSALACSDSHGRAPSESARDDDEQEAGAVPHQAATAANADATTDAAECSGSDAGRELDMDEATALGSADEHARRTGGRRVHTLTYSPIDAPARANVVTSVTLELRADPVHALLFERSGPEPNVCSHELQLDAMLTLVANDGSLRGELEGTLRVTRAQTHFEAHGPGRALSGSYLVPGDATFRLEATLDAPNLETGVEGEGAMWTGKLWLEFDRDGVESRTHAAATWTVPHL